MQKITNVVALTMAIETLSSIEGFDADAIAKLQKVKASYEKKSHSEHKPTQTQLDNERLKARILDLMDADTRYTVSDIVKALDNEFSNQKISALMNSMVDTSVTKVTEKRRSYFTLIAEV